MKIPLDNHIGANQLIEDLAELEHKQWSHWTKYFLSQDIEKNREKWMEQARKLYSELSEEEKESDRAWAREVLKVQYKSAEKELIRRKNEI